LLKTYPIYSFKALLTVHCDISVEYEPTGRTIYLQFISYEGWNFNSGNYLFTTDTK